MGKYGFTLIMAAMRHKADVNSVRFIDIFVRIADLSSKFLPIHLFLVKGFYSSYILALYWCVEETPLGDG